MGWLFAGLVGGCVAVTGCGRIGFDHASDATSSGDVGGDSVPFACTLGDARVIDAISGHCYMLFVQAATWSAAEATCGALGPGTHVATIAAVRENTLVRQLAARRVWLGGTDVVVEGTWTWVDGAPFVYTNWASGEPNSDAFDCVEQIGNDPATWNEDDCNAPEAYVCEH